MLYIISNLKIYCDISTNISLRNIGNCLYICVKCFWQQATIYNKMSNKSETVIKSIKLIQELVYIFEQHPY